MTICPFHRETLVISWRRSLRLCCVPETIGKHKEKSRLLEGAVRGCSLLQSRYICKTTGEHVPVGSGNIIVSAKIDYVENALYLQNLKIVSVCLFVCFLMYVGVCMCLSVYLCGCTCVSVRVCVRVFVWLHACVYAFVHACVIACTHICFSACICVYIAILQTRGEGNKAAAFEASALRACVRTCVCMYSRVRG